MATRIYDITHTHTVILSGQVTGIEHLLMPAVPEFIGGLAATVVSAAVSWAFRKWRRSGTPTTTDDVTRS